MYFDISMLEQFDKCSVLLQLDSHMEEECLKVPVPCTFHSFGCETHVRLILTLYLYRSRNACMFKKPI